MAKNKNKPTKETIEMDKSDEVLVEVKKNKKDKKENYEYTSIKSLNFTFAKKNDKIL